MSKDKSSSNKVADAGEFVPYAKKHTATKKNLEDTGVTLSQLFEEPDWVEMASSGYCPESIAYLTAVYYGLRKKPRNYHFGSISVSQWNDSYIKAIENIKHLFGFTQSQKDIDAFNVRFNALMGCPNPADLPLEECYPVYAAGKGGTRKIQHSLTFSRKQNELYRWLPKLGWPDNKQAIKTTHFPVEFTNGQWGLCKPDSKGYSYTDDLIFDTYDEVLIAFKNQESTKKSPYIPKKKALDFDQTGVGNIDVTGDELIEKFGFRAIQYGRSLSNNERQLWLNNVYYALETLCQTIKMPSTKWVGLGGLAIAFGARGSGTASAHFEPDLFAINLSRRTGPGSLAHEFFHALDHRLKRKLKDCSWNLGSDHTNYATRIIHQYDMDTFCATEFEAPSHYKILRSFFDCSLYHESDCDFVNQARSLTKQHGGYSYWSSIHEIYARCFEAYIEDKLLRHEINCPWLSFGTLESDYSRNKKNLHPYPIGEERDVFYDKWERFFDVLYSGHNQ